MKEGKQDEVSTKTVEELIAQAKALGPEKFVVKFIRKNRGAINKITGKPYMGVHVVYSGLNEMLGRVWPDKAPQEITTELVAKNVITIRPAKGGPTVYVRGEEYVFDGKAHAAGKGAKKVPDRVVRDLEKIVG
jgi:hypothetical protein